jgi:hypothetical protein
MFEVIKNFPTENEVRSACGSVEEFEFRQFEYYWLASYRLISHS